MIDRYRYAWAALKSADKYCQFYTGQSANAHIGRSLIQGDNSGQLQPPVALVPMVLAASGPLLQLPPAQAG